MNMTRLPHFLFPLLLIAPLHASAECGFAHNGEEMTIVVGKKSNTCFGSDGFRAAFKEQLVASVAAMDAEEARGRRKKPIDERTASGERLWALQEKVYQAGSPTGRYFGQR